MECAHPYKLPDWLFEDVYRRSEVGEHEKLPFERSPKSNFICLFAVHDRVILRPSLPSLSVNFYWNSTTELFFHLPPRELLLKFITILTRTFITLAMLSSHMKDFYLICDIFQHIWIVFIFCDEKFVDFHGVIKCPVHKYRKMEVDYCSDGWC